MFHNHSLYNDLNLPIFRDLEELISVPRLGEGSINGGRTQIAFPPVSVAKAALGLVLFF